VPQSETSFFVTFDLAGLATGPYSVRAVDGANSTELASAFTVTTGNPGRFEARLLTPAQVFLGRESVLFVEYANPGETDTPAPLVTLVSQNAFLANPSINDVALFGIPPDPPRSTVAQFLAISQTGPAGVSAGPPADAWVRFKMMAR
jgi:hypothetical protein